MSNKFKSPNIAFQNVISITCSDDAVEPLIELFETLKSLGQMGCSRTITINWDGDGRDRLDNITVNGLTLANWKIEWERLNKINIEFKSTNSSNTENKNESNGKTS